MLHKASEQGEHGKKDSEHKKKAEEGGTHKGSKSMTEQADNLRKPDA